MVSMRLHICFLLALFSSTAVYAQLTVEQLQGVSVSATTLLTVRIRDVGGTQEFVNQDHWEIYFRIGPGGVITGSQHHTVTRDGNHIGSEGNNFSQTIGKPGRGFNGLQSLWLLEDHSLVNLLALKMAWGAKTIFTFQPTERGFTCSVKRSNVREVGKPVMQRPSISGGHPIEILSARQLSSSCQATRG
jgi:hypothetical protein